MQMGRADNIKNIFQDWSGKLLIIFYITSGKKDNSICA